jgi:hypothetical protein
MYNAHELLEKLNLHPLTRQIVAEEKAKVIEARKEAALERDKLLKEIGKIPSNDVATCDLQKELNRFESEIRILRERIAGRIAQNWRKRQELENRISTIEGGLNETADLEISKAIGFFLDRHAELRHATVHKDTRDQGLNLVTLRRSLETSTNAAAIEGAMQYCLAAARTLETLRLEPAVEPGVIQALIDNLPGIDETKPANYSKAPERVGPIPELLTLPSDSELSWKKNKCLREADKILRK